MITEWARPVQNTLGAVVTAIDVPLGLVKDAARPVYWVLDHEILHCHSCWKEFSVKLSSTTAGLRTGLLR